MQPIGFTQKVQEVNNTPLNYQSMFRYILFFVFTCSLLFSSGLKAQNLFNTSAPDSAKVEESKKMRDELGRSTPRGTVRGFFTAIADEDHSVR